MKINRNFPFLLLLLGMLLLVVAFGTHNTIFSWAAIILVVFALILNGRWARSKRK